MSGLGDAATLQREWREERIALDNKYRAIGKAYGIDANRLKRINDAISIASLTSDFHPGIRDKAIESLAVFIEGVTTSSKTMKAFDATRKGRS